MLGLLELGPAAPGVLRYTWMQIHGGRLAGEPLLRLAWMHKKSIGGVTYRDALFAVVRLNTGHGALRGLLCEGSAKRRKAVGRRDARASALVDTKGTRGVKRSDALMASLPQPWCQFRTPVGCKSSSSNSFRMPCFPGLPVLCDICDWVCMITDGGNVRNVYLGQRPDGPFQAEVTVKNSIMTVKINCQTLMNDDVSYWSPYDNYFKAGGTFLMWEARADLCFFSYQVYSNAVGRGLRAVGGQP